MNLTFRAHLCYITFGFHWFCPTIQPLDYIHDHALCMSAYSTSTETTDSSLKMQDKLCGQRESVQNDIVADVDRRSFHSRSANGDL